MKKLQSKGVDVKLNPFTGERIRPWTTTVQKLAKVLSDAGSSKEKKKKITFCQKGSFHILTRNPT